MKFFVELIKTQGGHPRIARKTAMNTQARPQDRIVTTAEKAQNLFADGYRARVIETADFFANIPANTARFGNFENFLLLHSCILVRTPKGDTYCICPEELTCNCPASVQCKHLKGLHSLMLASAEQLYKSACEAKQWNKPRYETLLGKAILLETLSAKISIRGAK